jgi:hypothetical protein
MGMSTKAVVIQLDMAIRVGFGRLFMAASRPATVALRDGIARYMN